MSKGRNKKYSYYHCQNKKCPEYGQCIKGQRIEEEYLLLLQRINPRSRFLQVFKEVIQDVWQDSARFIEDSIKSFQSQLANLELKKRRIFDVYEEGGYSKEEFSERKNSIDKEIAVIKYTLDSDKIEHFDLNGVFEYIADFISNFSKQWKQLPVKSRLRFNKIIFPDGIPFQKKDGYGTAKLGFIYKLNQEFNNDKSYLVQFTRLNLNQIIHELKHYEELIKEIEEENQFSRAA